MRRVGRLLAARARLDGLILLSPPGGDVADLAGTEWRLAELLGDALEVRGCQHGVGFEATSPRNTVDSEHQGASRRQRQLVGEATVPCKRGNRAAPLLVSDRKARSAAA